jgi:hypothetical protein
MDGCEVSNAINTIAQAQINNLRVCGASGGTPYVNMTRPINLNNDCPNGYEPCSQFSNYSNTICVAAGTTVSSCPVTDIQIVTAFDLSSFNFDPLNTTIPLYKSLAYGNSFVVYSN